MKHHLDNIVDFAVDYFKKLKKDYGTGKERKTELRLFEDIEATKVVIRNTKLYVNRAEGFVGTSLKKDEYVTECSDIDDVICFTADGKMMITKVDSKTFIGKDIIHVAIFKKKDKRTTYNMVYRDGKAGNTYVKRFAVTSVTRDREYDLSQGKKDSKILYFSANPNGEAEVITVLLRQVGSIRKVKFDLDFAEILIKGRNVKGNIVTKYSVKRIELKEEGVSTLKPRRIWFDDTVKRLNVDERGELLGEFRGEDRLLIVTQDGVAKTIKPELTTRFDNEIIVLEKWIKDKPVSAIYWEAEKERFYVKRFLIEHPDKEEKFISDHEDSFLELVSTDYFPMAEIVYTKPKGKERRENEKVNIEDFIAIKGIKALGNQLTSEKVNEINLLDPMPYEKEEEETEDTNETDSEESINGEDIKSGNIKAPDKKSNSDDQPSLFDE